MMTSPLRARGFRHWLVEAATLAVGCLGALALPGVAVADHCKIVKIAELPITMTDFRPLLTANVNGVDVKLLVGSGAFYSTISAGNAAELKLSTYPLPIGFEVRGATGAANMALARIKVFTVANVPIHDVEFLVGGGELGPEGIGVLGQNFLHLGDVEYDLAHASVSLLKVQECGKTPLAYWAPVGSAYSVIDMIVEPNANAERLGSRIPQNTGSLSHTIGTAHVNGVAIRVLFDTGAATSVLSLKAAARVGVTPESPGAQFAGPSWGIGSRMVASYTAPFASFKLGDEEIRNTRLRIADINVDNVEMLLGADFFLSHHVYVANSQRKLYFTYNGGPVFNLTSLKNAQRNPASTSTDAGTAGRSGSGAGDGAQTADGTIDAGELARRAAVAASQRDFTTALSDLDRACELAPNHAEYFYQRGEVHRQMAQNPAALADYDTALTLKPDDVAVRVARAKMHFHQNDNAAALADLDAADLAATQQADIRLDMAHVYRASERLPAAIRQYDLWIAAHADDARVPNALASRCWTKALTGEQLASALKDCNAALKRTDKSSSSYAHFLTSRALVWLRLGDYDKSIADYDASLKLEPTQAWAWYGRGIARARKNGSVAGESDAAHGKALLPTIDADFRRYGIEH